MKAIIPVAGVGERLRPFTHTTPKPLLSLAGKPILAHIIDWLIEQGVRELVLVVGYMGDQIENFVEERYDLPVNIVYQEKLSGLGYAIYLALKHISTEPFLVVLGDTILEADLSSIINETNKNFIGITEVEDPRRFGVVEMSGQNIIRVEEKPQYPKSNQIIAGFYCFSRKEMLEEALKSNIESGIKTHGEIQLTDALQKMLKAGEKFEGFAIDGWYDCGKPETLLQTQRHLLSKNKYTTEREGSIIFPPVYIEESASVEGSIVGPYVSIGKNSHIKNSILMDSIVGDGTTLSKCILESSILGNDSTFIGITYKLNIGNSSKVELEWK